MSTLLLIRHGQARAFEADSDRLSEMGEHQARRLGEYLSSLQEPIDEVYTGTLERHRRTWALAAEELQKRGRPVASAVVDPGWNEYDAPAILSRLMPVLSQRDEAFRELVVAFQENIAGPERNRYFQRMFEVLMERWQAGVAAAEGVEPFEAFYERVTQSLSNVTESGGNRRVLVFTSGGPIGVCVQSVLGAPRSAALRLNSRVKNASMTEFVFSRGRMSLDYFNATQFLPAPLLTFR